MKLAWLGMAQGKGLCFMRPGKYLRVQQRWIRDSPEVAKFVEQLRVEDGFDRQSRLVDEIRKITNRHPYFATHRRWAAKNSKARHRGRGSYPWWNKREHERRAERDRVLKIRR